jgi:hypothetical protein
VAGAGNSISLRVMNLRLEHYFHDHPRHVSSKRSRQVSSGEERLSGPRARTPYRARSVRDSSTADASGNL